MLRTRNLSRDRKNSTKEKCHNPVLRRMSHLISHGESSLDKGFGRWARWSLKEYPLLESLSEFFPCVTWRWLMDYGGRTCSAEISLLLLFSSFEASATYGEHRKSHASHPVTKG